jgi:hypothetical protein
MTGARRPENLARRRSYRSRQPAVGLSVEDVFDRVEEERCPTLTAVLTSLPAHLAGVGGVGGDGRRRVQNRRGAHRFSRQPDDAGLCHKAGGTAILSGLDSPVTRQNFGLPPPKSLLCCTPKWSLNLPCRAVVIVPLATQYLPRRPARDSRSEGCSIGPEPRMHADTVRRGGSR